MLATPPEKGVGQRIAYCRGQLDNLSVEALARYSKNFDPAGISRPTIVRYESGENIPGARELRILCDALWVPANWILFGTVGPDVENSAGGALLNALNRFVQGASWDGVQGGWMERLAEDQRQAEIEKRQKWIDEARKPTPKS
ncbi:MAG: helix-turn-helix domain-containing protein [Rhodocyclaceae bacterium]|nr:helix-turn-helix domain-containing protein [Rhodocyclaceae bacterium]